MKKQIRIILTIILTICLLTGCRKHTMPDDFNISFQFGTTDDTMITIDTYNQIISRGIDQSNCLTFKISADDKKDIYDRMIEDILHGYSGAYHGPTTEGGENLKFSIKYTSRKHTDIITGDYTTFSCEKKDTKTLIDFRDYMIDYVKGTKEYAKLMNG